MVSLPALDVPRLIRSTRRGAIGGLAATVGMTVYRIPVFRALPPTAEFWSRYVAGGEPADHPFPGLVLHVLYGTVGGAIFGALTSVRPIRDPIVRERLYLVAGLLYGLLLSVIGSRIIFVYLLGRKLRPEHAVVFHVGHAIYGVTLGTFMAADAPLGAVYDESEPTRPPSEKQRH